MRAQSVPIFFLSYARLDHEAAETVKGELVRAGAQVWQDTEQIRMGEWKASIARAIGDATAFVLIVTTNSLASTEVAVELDAALDAGHQPLLMTFSNDLRFMNGCRPNIGLHHVSIISDPEIRGRLVADFVSHPPRRLRRFINVGSIDHAVPRRALLDQLRSHLLDTAGYPQIAREVFITGASGGGKTMFARQACHDPQIIAAYFSGRIYFDMQSPVPFDDQVQHALSTVIGADGVAAPQVRPWEHLFQLTRQSPWLFVFDNIPEHLDLAPLRIASDSDRLARLFVCSTSEHRLNVDAPVVRISALSDDEAAAAILGGAQTPNMELMRCCLTSILEISGNWPAEIEQTRIELSRLRSTLPSLNDALVQLATRLGRGENSVLSAPDDHSSVVKRLAIAESNSKLWSLLWPLAALPAGARVPVPILQFLWRASPEGTQERLRLLSSAELILGYDPETSEATLLRPMVWYYLRQRLAALISEQQLRLLGLRNGHFWQDAKVRSAYYLYVTNPKLSQSGAAAYAVDLSRERLLEQFLLNGWRGIVADVLRSDNHNINYSGVTRLIHQAPSIGNNAERFRDEIDKLPWTQH